VNEAAGMSMKETQEAIPAAMEESKDLPRFVAEEVSRAFPDFRCLRCRNDTFFFTGSYLAGQILISRTEGFQSHLTDAVHTIALICQRCGFVEQHAADIFFGADKPIDVGE